MFGELLAKRLLPAPLITGAVCLTMHLTNHSKGLSKVLDGNGLGARPNIEEDPLILVSPPAPSTPPSDSSQSNNNDGNGENGQSQESSESSSNSQQESSSDSTTDSSASSAQTSSRSAATSSVSRTDPWEALRFLVTDINLNSQSWIRIKGLNSSHAAFSRVTKLSETLAILKSQAEKANAGSTEGGVPGAGTPS